MLLLSQLGLTSVLLSTKFISLVIHVYSSMDYARKLFDTMSQRDVFLWNAMIKGYADVGPCQEAVTLFKDMHQTGFLPDNHTFPSVVRSCSVISAFREGTEVHCFC
ncbi:hypothetical protein MANES_09G037000v8 [Manihot esculenta]|uniref:Pentatricopeptide repeat-containing protein n=1 Tax=Manihot esculenta TaxID=3983 RepID=A0A2C9V9A7_MANES|nr:hypothetical protein MANES_09G037000v8 [Manihot esculenta]